MVQGKERRVATGFRPFAPISSVSFFRLLASIACDRYLDLCHLDAEQAIL